jgi:hypothetical protein
VILERKYKKKLLCTGVATRADVVDEETVENTRNLTRRPAAEFGAEKQLQICGEI